MGWVALAYLLLGASVTVRASAGLCGAGGAAQVSIGALGVCAQLDAVLALEDGRLRLTPRYGTQRQRRRGKRPGAVWRDALRKALHASGGARAQVCVRLGLPEAHETALAAGAARALLASLLAAASDEASWELVVRPDYAEPGLLLTARCIFSFTLGDIMFAALRAAANQRWKEGTRWLSIQSRA